MYLKAHLKAQKACFFFYFAFLFDAKALRRKKRTAMHEKHTSRREMRTPRILFCKGPKRLSF